MFTRKLIYSFYHYLNAFTFRFALLSEFYSLKNKSFRYPNFIFFKIFFAPQLYEDRVNLMRFISSDESTLLIDVGGNTGYWSWDFIKFYPKTTIIAFEPFEKVSKIYKERYKNSKINVEVNNVGLSSKKEILNFYLSEDTTFSSFQKYSKKHRNKLNHIVGNIKLTCDKLDNYKIPPAKYKKIFLKIDVQGHEVNVLKGAIETLKIVDIVLIETSFAHEYENQNPSFSEVSSILRLADLYPIVFQSFSKRLSFVAWQRDVIFVKSKYLNKIWL